MTSLPRIIRLAEFLFPSFGYTKKNKTSSRQLAQAIYPENFARSLVIEEFIEFFKNTEIFKADHLKIAVVGGSSKEPELEVFKSLNIDVDVTLLGIDPGVNYLDLNKPNIDLQNSNFDIVLCSQVFEHIWNYHDAINSLKSLMSEKTYLWISCPSSNRPHGLSFYFAAGLTESFLINNLKHHELNVEASGTLGSRRIYRSTHTLPTWLSVRGNKFPPIWAFESHPYDKASLLYRVAFSLRYVHRSFELLFFSGKVTTDIRTASESWACAKI
jgi:hypothetical protein